MAEKVKAEPRSCSVLGKRRSKSQTKESMVEKVKANPRNSQWKRLRQVPDDHDQPAEDEPHPRGRDPLPLDARIAVLPMRGGGGTQTKVYKKTRERLQGIIGPDNEVIELNVTSKTADDELRQLSPFYPVGDIPIDRFVPDLKGETSESVEGLWQGLKVFEKADHDPTKFTIKDMKNLKRTSRKFGRVLGHYQGPTESYLNYADARRHLYIPLYRWVLSNRVKPIVESRIVKEIMKGNAIIFRDFNTNGDPDVPKVLSHAQVLKQYAIELASESLP